MNKKKEEESCYKVVRVINIWSKNYTEYESNDKIIKFIKLDHI